MRAISRERISAAINPFCFLPTSVKDNLQFEALSEEQKQRCCALASEMGIADCLNSQSALALSDGQKKKVQILMTLMKDADLYLLDEPLAHLDVNSKEVVIAVSLRETSGRALCVTMHGDEQFWKFFDRVIALDQLGMSTGFPDVVHAEL